MDLSGYRELFRPSLPDFFFFIIIISNRATLLPTDCSAHPVGPVLSSAGAAIWAASANTITTAAKHSPGRLRSTSPSSRSRPISNTTGCARTAPSWRPGSRTTDLRRTTVPAITVATVHSEHRWRRRRRLTPAGPAITRKKKISAAATSDSSRTRSAADTLSSSPPRTATATDRRRSSKRGRTESQHLEGMGSSLSEGWIKINSPIEEKLKY